MWQIGSMKAVEGRPLIFKPYSTQMPLSLGLPALSALVRFSPSVPPRTGEPWASLLLSMDAGEGNTSEILTSLEIGSLRLFQQ